MTGITHRAAAAAVAGVAALAAMTAVGATAAPAHQGATRVAQAAAPQRSAHLDTAQPDTAHHAAAAVVTRPAHPSAFDSVANPHHSLPASPSFYDTCAAHGVDSQQCISTTLAAINHARRVEGVRPMSLPSGYAAMSPRHQLGLIVQDERTARGVRPLTGLKHTLDLTADRAASARQDPDIGSRAPGLSNVMAWGSNWAEDAGALGSDYDWMYDDGPGSSNIDCTSGNHSGCWGHRENILSDLPGASTLAGVGEAKVAGTPWQSWTLLLVGVGGHPRTASVRP